MKTGKHLVKLCRYVVLLYKAFCQLLSELRYQDTISVRCNVNNFSKAMLSHKNSMRHLEEEPGFKNVKNKHLGMPPF